MNLLVFNLRMDAGDPVLGHVTAWTNALARRCDHVSVITMSTGRIDVAENVSVHSLGKERGYSEPRRLARFYRLVSGVLRRTRIDACFAHMAPLFTVLFAPVARPARIPILLWYAHGSVTRTLRLANAAADRCVTSTPGGFRLPSDKVFYLGQGIDLDLFRPPPRPASTEAVVSVGRITPVKRIEEMLEAVSVLHRERGVDVPLRLFGGPHTAEDRDYELNLKGLAGRLELNGLVNFEGPLPFDQVPAAYHRGGIFLNLSETGSIDKAILESMASGCIPVSRNASFQTIARAHGLEWLVPGEGAAPVADCLGEVLAQPRDERARLSQRLREIVAEDHSLDRLADAIKEHLDELVATKGRAAR